MELVSGASLGLYRLVEPVGTGGMAEVWRAFQPGLDRDVAIKLLAPRYAGEPGYLDRFRREARAISRLDHPNILTVLDFGEQDGFTYMVTPYIEGGTLAQRLGRPWSLDETLRVLEPLASALDYAHAEGIIHRDVKPSNVLISGRGRVILGDFGVARVLEGTTVLTQAGMVVGTPQYMAPEQAEGEPAQPAGDLYSLGIVAYELLTGRPPFQAATPLAVLRAHVDKPLPPPRTINPALSPALEAVLFKALAKNPADRYPSGLELVRALASTAPTAAELVTTWEPAWNPPPTPTPPLMSRPARRRFSTIGLLALVGLAVALVAAGALGSRLLAPTEQPAPTVTLLVAAPATATSGSSATPTPAPATATTILTPTPAPAVAATVAPPTATAAPTLALATESVPPALLAQPTTVAAPTPLVLSPAVLQSVLQTDRAAVAAKGFLVDTDAVAPPLGNDVLIAIKGICGGSADGTCQQVFFFVGTRYLGTDTFKPSTSIGAIGPAGSGRIRVSYANYRPNDPLCCPGLPPVPITYAWDGGSLKPNGTPPGH